MHKVSVLGKETIIVGTRLTEFIAQETLALNRSSYIFVSDENVAPLHLQPLLDVFEKKTNSRILKVIIPPGEVHKTREMKSKIEDYLLSSGVTRDSVIIALGGGVIGDLAGFVAATFMRGIPIIQIPTTLLAMVDSSVGGKTAIDTPHGKNLIGAFHQPTRVLIDIDYLKTLPRREFVNGLAEVIKTAAIWKEEDFLMLENYPEKVLGLVGGSVDAQSEELLLKLILGSVQVKAHVVTVDEKETGLRGLLNFGHTVGHAIEAIVFPEMLHGECVAIGMVLEAEIARHLQYLNNVSVGRLVRCLQAYGLPVALGDKVYKSKTSRTCSVEKMMEIMKLDKKNKGDQKRMVLLAKIGKTVEPNAMYVKDEIITRVLSPAVQIIPRPVNSDEIRLNVPGSKSISNRALVMAALGRGPCRLHGLLHSDDVQVMLDSLQKLVGITYSWENDGETLLVSGGAGQLKVPDSELYLGNAGTASRFLTTVTALIKNSHSSGRPTTLTGNARMKQRPIGPLVDALRENGCEIKCLESEGCFPLEVTPSGLKGGRIKLSAKISSQYVSSILISAPYADQPVILDLSGDQVISQPYIDMTIAMMKSFGIDVKRDGNVYHIPLGVYSNPSEYLIEADASSATYPLAFAAITGGKVTVTNIGKKSLQGDAEFAVKVLKEMGCTVTQTDTTTSVTGTPNLRPLPNIDMETMTDAFMTATVLAAVARNPNDEDRNTTRITGIANQRVKECDRIAAMITELSKLGVKASELADGLQIHGIDRTKLINTAPKGIKCYDDHRIAISFSVLCCAFPVNQPSPIVTEKKCVEKTWPAWWDTLQNTLKMDQIGIDLHPGHEDSTEKVAKVNQTIVLIGMRGAGKTHMGRSAARFLQYTFVDMDTYFEEQVSMSIPKFIDAHGWEQFRAKESEYLSRALREHPTDTVIACGGGIVESSSNRDVLKKWNGLVVHIKRDITAIEAYLNIDKTRPSYGEDIRSVWNRRKPLYDESSNAEFLIMTPGQGVDIATHYKAIDGDFGRFLKTKIQGAEELPYDKLSFFVSLTCSNVEEFLPILDTISVGAHALELRVDLLEKDDPEFIGIQVALLRRHSSLPIVYTVRTQEQGGKFPNDQPQKMFELIALGFKLGCEYVDIEFSAPLDRFRGLLANKGTSKVIGSYHDTQGIATWTPNGSMAQKFKELHQLSDIIKLIGKAKAFKDNFAVYTFVHDIAPTLCEQKKPLIALLMGPEGQLSRSLNSFFTPVTHPSVPTPAAPGQVSIRQIHQTRANSGLLPKRNYVLFGKPIQQSMSPTIHNTGFEELSLPHHYSLVETDDINTVKQSLVNVDGASVTIPLKIQAIQLCDVISDSAKAIGAINTIYKKDTKVYGTNTDWIGMRNLIQKSIQGDFIGVVLGAGGTSRAAIYALQQLKAKEIRIWNRTESKAIELAKEFGAVATNLDECLSGNETIVVIGTIPASAQESLSIDFTGKKGLVLDMAYRPRETRLLLEAKKHGLATVEGIQVLLEQGYEQFRIWTGINAPQSFISNKVLLSYE